MYIRKSKTHLGGSKRRYIQTTKSRTYFRNSNPFTDPTVAAVDLKFGEISNRI